MRLSNQNLRKVLDRLYDGEMGTSFYLLQCRNFPKYEHQIYLWLDRNGLHGKKLIEFFQNESFSHDGQGALNGINFIVRKITNNKFNVLNEKDLKL